jgi:hypothetical protein
MSEPALLPAFDILWQVNTTKRPVSGRTRFERVELVETYLDPYPFYPWGPWGPYWWYDPAFPRTYVGLGGPMILNRDIATGVYR